MEQDQLHAKMKKVQKGHLQKGRQWFQSQDQSKLSDWCMVREGANLPELLVLANSQSTIVVVLKDPSELRHMQKLICPRLGKLSPWFSPTNW